MRRKDLVVGNDYLYATSNNWLTDRYGSPQRVTVVDTRTWNNRGYRRWGSNSDEKQEWTLQDGSTISLRETFEVTPHGSGVLISRNGKIEITQPRNIRGPWHQLWAQYQDELARREKAAAWKKNRDQETRERMDRVRSVLTQVSEEFRNVGVYLDSQSIHGLRLSGLEKLANALEGAQEKEDESHE